MMIASVYIKDGNIHLYNEKASFSNIGGIAYELGRPLLDFVCYEPERFIDGFNMITEAFNNEYAYQGARDPEYQSGLKQLMGDMQQKEIYLFFYSQMFMDFIFTFIDSPKKAIEQLSEKIPGVREKLSWTIDFEWPTSSLVVVIYTDKEKRLFRAVKDVVELMAEDLKSAQEAMKYEIELLIALRKDVDLSGTSPMEYLYMLEALNAEHSGGFHFLEKPLRSFYGVTKPPEIVELYQIDTVKNLLRFEFIKMIEHDIFIKKCKNCERFFIPRRRVDAEYCERIWGDSNRKCSEIGATLRYEKKVSENPILEAHKKAYRRFNSRTRAKKMTQSEFLQWSDEAGRKRDECLAGKLSFEEFVEWLEQGRIRKERRKSGGTRKVK